MTEVYEFIRDFVDPEHFDMSEYSNFTVNADYKDIKDQANPWCQTAGCIAGWAWTHQHREELADQAEVLVEDFYSNSDFEGAVDAEADLAPDSNYHVQAAVYLGMTTKQADELFTLEPTHNNVWYKYREDLALAHYTESGQLTHERVQFNQITKDHAEVMLLKLITGEWTFACDD
tara:strand:+ start:173 stop:697 length:525 start_codon:yes stop_codon:yes gene_type:complete